MGSELQPPPASPVHWSVWRIDAPAVRVTVGPHQTAQAAKYEASRSLDGAHPSELECEIVKGE